MKRTKKSEKKRLFEVGLYVDLAHSIRVQADSAEEAEDIASRMVDKMKVEEANSIMDWTTKVDELGLDGKETIARWRRNDSYEYVQGGVNEGGLVE